MGLQSLTLALRGFSEGFLTACTFDYLTRTFDNRLFIGAIFTFSYVIPMLMIIYFYSQIVSKVFSHEKALREQVSRGKGPEQEQICN